MTQTEISKLKCTRVEMKVRNKGVTYYKNVFRHGRKIVATIWEPCDITNYMYSVNVPVGGNYALNAKFAEYPDAVVKMEEFLRCIHIK